MKSLFILLLAISTTYSGSFMFPSRNPYRSYNYPLQTNLKSKIIKNLVEHPQFESLQMDLLQNNFIDELINYRGISSVAQYVNYYYPNIGNKYLDILMKNHFRDFYYVIKEYNNNKAFSKTVKNNSVRPTLHTPISTTTTSTPTASFDNIVVTSKDTTTRTTTNEKKNTNVKYFNCSNKNSEDCLQVVEKKYRDEFSYKLKWANSWKESDVW